MSRAARKLQPDKLARLLARIDAVLAQPGTFPSARAWCKAAGLSESYIAALRNRGGREGTGEVNDVKHEAVAALARAANKPVAWLMGDSDTETSPTGGAGLGIELALEKFEWPGDLSPDAAREIQRRARDEATGPDDLPVRYWTARLTKILDDVREQELGSHTRRRDR